MDHAGSMLPYKVVLLEAVVVVVLKIKWNLWLTAPKVATPVNWTSATDWQMAARRDNVISITLCFVTDLIFF